MSWSYSKSARRFGLSPIVDSGNKRIWDNNTTWTFMSAGNMKRAVPVILVIMFITSYLFFTQTITITESTHRKGVSAVSKGGGPTPEPPEPPVNTTEPETTENPSFIRSIGPGVPGVLSSKVDSTNNTLYIITPTYHRITQVPDLTRLCQTLMHLEEMLWIVVEDNCCIDPEVNATINACPVPSVYMHNIKFPKKYKGKGVEPRNTALHWLRNNIPANTPPGVVYFADDDNTYNLRLFEEIRTTRVVSVFPVGLVSGAVIEKPIVKDSVVVGWKSLFDKRKFNVDMAGFAFHTDRLFLNPMPIFNSRKNGYLETDFISNLKVGVKELEPKAKECTEVLVWHTKTANHNLMPRVKNEYKNSRKPCKC